MFLATLFRFSVPVLVGIVLDRVLGAKGGSQEGVSLPWMGALEYPGKFLWLAGLLVVMLTVLAGVFAALKGRWAAQSSDGIARCLKERIFAHLQGISLRALDKHETGDLVQRSTSDVETIRMALSSQVVEIGHAIVLLGLALPVMLWMNPLLTGAAFFLVGPLIFFGLIYFRRVGWIFLEVDQAEGRVTSAVQENLSGLRVVRAFGRQQWEKDRFLEPNREYREQNIRLIQLMAIYWSFSDFLVLLQFALVLGTGIFLIGEGLLSVGVLFTFIMLLELVLQPVRQMGRTLTEMGKARIALRRIMEILDAPVEDAGGRCPGNPARGALEFRGVVFSHLRGTPVLEKISFRVKPGETLAIVGPSGSGKSTIFHLLQRFYDPDSGEILLDDVPLQGWDRSWLRRQMAVVMQEPFLFSRTLGENICLGQPEASLEKVSHAATAAHIHHTIETFPFGYQTLVGERGITLSGGQRQRVALARALLMDSPLLLLDDALSAVDSGTEEMILKALRDRRGKQTTLVIAHRLATLMEADKVLVLQEGRLVQWGSPPELRKEEGWFRRAWLRQNPAEMKAGDYRQ